MKFKLILENYKLEKLLRLTLYWAAATYMYVS